MFTNDWYNSSYYSDPEATQPDPDGSASGDGRVLRGGGWGDRPGFSRSAFRGRLGPGYRYYYIGFRCALGTP